MPAGDDAAHRGTCFCGAVEIEARGAPFAMGYCHCRDCRAWGAAPVTSYTLWPGAAVAVVRGEGDLASYSKSGTTRRRTCGICGGHVMSELPDAGMVDVYADILPTLDFVPEAHVHYASSVLRIADGLPKFADLPAEAGGSGETVAE